MSNNNIKIALINNVAFENEEPIDPFLLVRFQEKLTNYCTEENEICLEFLNERGGFLLIEYNHTELCLKKCDKYCNLNTHVNNVLEFYLKGVDVYLYCVSNSFFPKSMKSSSLVVFKEDLNDVFNEDLEISENALKKIYMGIFQKYSEMKKSKKHILPMKILEKEINIYLKNEILYLLEQFECIVAGGFALYFEGLTKSYGDIDVFVYSQNSFENIKKYLEEKYKIEPFKKEFYEYEYERSSIQDIQNFKILVDGSMIDIQLIGISACFENYVDSFDLPFVRLYLNFHDDKLFVNYTKNYCSIKEFDSEKFSYTSKSMERYQKYIQRTNM